MKSSKCSTKKTIVAIASILILLTILCDLFTTATPSPKKRLLVTITQKFFEWMQHHPYSGFFAFLIVNASSVVFIVPAGIPLMLGSGCVYKEVYGWNVGIIVAAVSFVFGSSLGAVACFVLGRFFMREYARKWTRKYPLLEAIDIGEYMMHGGRCQAEIMKTLKYIPASLTAVSEQGLRIMTMINLILPLLPVGPVSYLCGTTSMALSSFAIANMASLPLVTLFVCAGASTGAVLSDPSGSEAKHIGENKWVILAGIFSSVAMITFVSLHIRKELDKVRSVISKIMLLLVTSCFSYSSCYFLDPGTSKIANETTTTIARASQDSRGKQQEK
jgi:uncharacterized membrane protein YdjX (TVP38/TMEM64 family)